MRRRRLLLLPPLFASTLLVSRGASAQLAPSTPTRSIADAIAQRMVDHDVTIAGRSVVNSGKLQTGAFDVAIEDGTSGIRVFARGKQPEVHEGDSVVATGTIKSYRGNLELAAYRIAVVKGPRRMLPLRELPIDPAVISQYTGRLARVHGRVTGSGTSEGGQWVRLHDPAVSAKGSLTVWVPANHGAPIDLSDVKEGDSLAVTGVIASYQDNQEDPVVWQLVPRDAADVQIARADAAMPGWILWVLLGGVLLVAAAMTIGRLSARRQIRALQETDARYNQLLALLPEAVIVHGHGTILFTNPAAAELLEQASEKELVGRLVEQYVAPESREVFAEHAAESQTSSGVRLAPARARMLTATGAPVDVEITSSPCVYRDQPAMVVLARDIGAQLRYERDLNALALVDELTGIQNRRAFTLFAEQELARARRNGRTPMLVFADLDGLKLINDQYGHAAGDAALRVMAAALRSMLRETDVVARWSGDEFVALMGESNDEAARQVGARLNAAMAALTPPELPYAVTASVGVSTLDPELPLRDAMERADAKLYEQKKRARRSALDLTPLDVEAVAQRD